MTVRGFESRVRGMWCVDANFESRKFREEPESMSVFAGSMIPSTVVYQIGALLDIFR